MLSHNLKMDLSKFKNSVEKKPDNKQGFLTKNYYKAKYWFYPPTVDRRKERFSQYKNFGVFLGSILFVVVFEDKIKNFLEIETDDLKKLSGQSPF